VLHILYIFERTPKNCLYNFRNKTFDMRDTTRSFFFVFTSGQPVASLPRTKAACQGTASALVISETFFLRFLPLLLLFFPSSCSFSFSSRFFVLFLRLVSSSRFFVFVSSSLLLHLSFHRVSSLFFFLMVSFCLLFFHHELTSLMYD